MLRVIFVPFILTIIINSDLMMTTQLSLGRLFPASRNRQRASSLLSQAIQSSFFRRPDFQPPKQKPLSKTKGTLKSLPSFPDVLWKFNKGLMDSGNSLVRGENPNQSSSTGKPVVDLVETFSKYGEFSPDVVEKASNKYDEVSEFNQVLNDNIAGPHKVSQKNPPKDPIKDIQKDTQKDPQKNPQKSKVGSDDVKLKIKQINEEELKKQNAITTTRKPVIVNKIEGVTNSPIFYIQLPAAPYEYHPSLGYISRPASPDLSNFLRPQIDFLNNGRPSIIYQPLTMDPDVLSSSTLPVTNATTSTTTAVQTSVISTIMSTTSMPSKSTTELTADSTSTPEFTTEQTTMILPDSETPAITASTTTKTSTKSETTTTSTMLETSAASTTSTSSSTTLTKPTISTTVSSQTAEISGTTFNPITIQPTNESLSEATSFTGIAGVTNSPITWLKGPYFFNGRPNHLFIFKAQPNKADRFDYLHKLYPKPGNYL